MTGPTVELFSTSILSNVKVRTRHERYTSVLAVKKIPYVYHDLASDDEAKSRWRRKAKDPQLPGILVNNEWVGSFDEFEEAVEFGELELFLGVNPAAAEAASSSAPHPAQSAVSSKDPSLYPTLPYAAEGAGRWKEPDADQFISSLNIKEDEINDADVDALLADIGKLPSQPTASAAPEKKYVPSQEAAIKPLRLAKMGSSTTHQRAPSGSSGQPGSGGTRSSPMARYSATQRSIKALAAEAAALTSNRKTSGALLREAVSQGKTLDDAMEESRMKQIISEDNLDDLFASLGLSNVDLADDEVDKFLEHGAIPQGLRLGGDRVHRPSSIADKARDEAAARDMVSKAKEKGYGSARSSLGNDVGLSKKLGGLEPALHITTTAEDVSADASTASGRTSALSAQTSTATDLSSVAPDPKPEEGSSKAQLSAEPTTALQEATSTEKTSDSAPSSAQKGDSAVIAEKASDSSSIRGDADRSSITKASSVTNGTGAGDTSEVRATAKDENDHDKTSSMAAPEEVIAAPTSNNSKLTESVPIRASAESVVGRAKADAPESVSGKSSVDTSEPISVPVQHAKSDSSNTAASSESSTELKPKEVSKPTISTVTPVSDGEQLLSSRESPSRNDKDRTPTKEISEDPIKSQSQASTEAAVDETAETDEDMQFALAQAVLIASRFESHDAEPTKTERQSSLPPVEGTAHVASTGSVPKGLSIVSPASTPAKTASASASTSTSPVPSPARDTSLGVGLTNSRSSSRQVSSLSTSSGGGGAVSSSRRAIDVSRPIDPALSPWQNNFSTSPGTSSSADIKKKLGIRGFTLGRDKSKDKEKDKDTSEGRDAKPSKSKSSETSTAAPSRHERTISQILREADAVLGLDDSDGGSDVEGSEDPAMFGASSVDVDIDAAPVIATRSSSKQFSS